MKYGILLLAFLLLISTADASTYTQTVNITFDSIEEYQPKHHGGSGGVGNATIVNSTEYFSQFENYSSIWKYSKPIHIPERQTDFDELIMYSEFTIEGNDWSFDDIKFIIPEMTFSYSSMYIRWGYSY